MKKRIKFLFAILPVLLLTGCFKTENSNNQHKHVYDSYSYDKDYHYHVCKDCNGIIDKEEHKADEGVVSKEPTLDAEGEKTFTCSVCGYKWTTPIEKLKESYTLRFLDWNGELLEEVTVKCGEDGYYTVTPEYEGMEFKEWDKPITNVKSDLEVHAVYGWTVNFYDYDETLYNTQIVCNGESAIAPEEPTRSGYRFDKWDKSLKNIVRNTDVNAEYVKQYKVSFLNYDNTVYQTVYVDEGGSLQPIEGPNRQGYTFVEWEGSLDNITENISLNPKYEIKTCKVDFKIVNSLVETQYVSYGQSAKDPTNIYVDWGNKRCYEISSWKDDYSSITKDITIYAKDYKVINDRPVIYVDTTNIAKGSEYATVNIYIFGPIKAYGINFELSYDNNLIINNDLVTINTNFTVGGNAAAGYNVDTKNSKISFSWIEGNGKEIAEGTYAKVMSLNFSIDSKLQEEMYEIIINDNIANTYFVNEELQPKSPVIISGGIKIN